MELLIISKKRSKTRRLTLGPKSLFAGSLALVITVFMLTGAAFIAGNQALFLDSVAINPTGYQHSQFNYHQEAQRKQHVLLNEARTETEIDLDVLARRLSKLQGHIMRLDALGARLAALANIKDIEFDVLKPPGMGGPKDVSVRKPLYVSDLILQINELDRKVKDRMDKLTAIESILIDTELHDSTLPAGRPLVGGWISSLYGWRHDPVTGRKGFHEGIDFVGRKDSLVISVAAGIVTWSDRRFGYGNMVEIKHGNGFVTRYAHNKINLVKMGEKVDKGQPIAIIGSSGRSTGTHVHFEVVKNGKPVNPSKFISLR